MNNTSDMTEQALEALLLEHPEEVGLYRRLARLREKVGNPAGALAAYSALVSREMDDYASWCRIGFLQFSLYQLDEAMATFGFVRDMAPGCADAWYGLAILSYQLGGVDDAISHIEHACALAPADSRIWAARAHIISTSCPDRERGYQAYRDWAERFADPLSRDAAPFGNARDPDKILRIGYVSADMNGHAVAYFIEPVLQRHDTQAVHVTVFANGRHDAVSDRLQGSVDAWLDVREMSDVALAAEIRRRNIDILVDLSGHTNGNRLHVFALRAAPVQVTWFGYMHTTGMEAMDYRLTDRAVTPEGTAQRYFSETLYYLESMACFAPDPSTPLNPEPPCLRNGYITFGSLNAIHKVSDNVLRLWGTLLHAVPEARLVLTSNMTEVNHAVKVYAERLDRLGLPLERLTLIPRMPIEEFLTLGDYIDIALDPFPTSGGTTTLHTIWMGLPIVAMEGKLPHETASAATLRGVGLGELVCENEQEYVNVACRLAADPESLRRYRRDNREKMAMSESMNYTGLTRDLEHAYRAMWTHWVNSDPHCPSTRRFVDGQAVPNFTQK